MFPLFHVVVSVVLTFLLYPIFGLSSLIILLFGIFIDVDHFFVYYIKYRDFNLKRFFYLFKPGRSGPFENYPYIFHTIEFLILFLILAYSLNVFWVTFIGLIFHILPDIYDEKYIYGKWFKFKNPSFILWLRNR